MDEAAQTLVITAVDDDNQEFDDDGDIVLPAKMTTYTFKLGKLMDACPICHAPRKEEFDINPDFNSSGEFQSVDLVFRCSQFDTHRWKQYWTEGESEEAKERARNYHW